MTTLLEKVARKRLPRKTEEGREFAPGLPSKKKVTDPRTVKKQEIWKSVVQEHDALRAKKHFDLRLADPRTGIAHSWALRYLPNPGEKRLAIQQPDHTKAYMKFTGTIGPGYGAGEVKRHSLLDAEILEASKDKIIFNRYQGRDTHEYALIRTKGKKWLLINRTPTRRNMPQMPTAKPKYKEIKPHQVDPQKPGRWDAKIDGAHCFTFDTPIDTLEYGRVRISALVNKDLEVHVRSAPIHGGQAQWKKVTRKYRNERNGELVRIIVASEKTRAIKCTSGHEIITPEGKVLAGDLSPGDLVLTEQKFPSSEIHQALLGMMMGDASSAIAGRSNWPRISFCHGPKQEFYIRHKRKILDPFCRSDVRREIVKNSFGEEKYRFNTRSLPCFSDLYGQFYQSGPKRISRRILDQITPISLAYWYMDDGHASVSRNKYGDNRQLFVSLHTEGFPEENTDLIVSWLKKRWGVGARKSYDQCKRAYVGMGAEAGMKFLSIVSPYILQEFRYKMGADYYKYDQSISHRLGTRILEKKDPVFKMYHCPILRIGRYEAPQRYGYNYVYNLEVEDNHTYIVSTILVGNSTYHIEGGKPIRAFSYRPSQRSDALIQHTYRVPGLSGKKAPKGMKETILRGEVYTIDPRTKKAIKAHELGGILNSNVIKARGIQKSKGKLINTIFDIVKFDGKDVSGLSTEEKRKLIKEVLARPGIKGLFHTPPSATTPKAKQALFDKIRKGQLKQTKEGIIVHSPEGVMTKVKFKPEWDVRISGVFTKPRSKAKGMAGGFTYNVVDGKKIRRTSRVGTGFTHELRRAMLENPEDFVGVIAKVTGLEQHISGAIRAQSFQGWHLDKNDPDRIPEIKR